MAADSKIEWTDATWTPIRARNRKTGKVGWHCEHKTSACANCYAEMLNIRLGTGLPFKPGHLDNGDVEVFLDEKMLRAPVDWKRPRKIFVCSMTDLFARFVTDEMLDLVFAVMALAQRHTFIVLTKRPERMREYIDGLTRQEWWKARLREAFGCEMRGPMGLYPNWPLPNVWLGCSIGNQEDADRDIPKLLAVPARVRFISYEPALGPFRPALSWLAPGGIDWIICGGESGPKARPMHPQWARDIRDICWRTKTAFFFKQWGEWREWDHGSKDSEVDADSEEADAIFISAVRPGFVTRDGRFFAKRRDIPDDETPCRLIERVGKKAAGRLLDGREWNEFPLTPPPEQS